VAYWGTLEGVVWALWCPPCLTHLACCVFVVVAVSGLVNLWAFNSVLNDLDESLGVDRGEAGSNKSAMTVREVGL